MGIPLSRTPSVRAFAFLLSGLLLVLCASTASTASKSGEPAFLPVGNDQTFNPEIITEVFFDRTGFLWIGTREGLYLHDGQRFRRFQHEIQNPESISSNGIRGILEDRHDRLWINTISGGLNLLDRTHWRFRNWRHQRNDPDSLIHDGVFALAEAPGGQLWVGTQAGLDHFDPETGRFRHLVLATGGEFIIALLNDRNGRLWVATLGQGLFRERADGNGFDLVPGPAAQAPPDLFSLAEGADGTIWAGARDGLYRVSSDGERLQPAALAPETLARRMISVTALLPTPSGELWLGTFGAGLFHLDADGTSLREVALPADGTGARQIDGGALAFSPDGKLFVGTFGAGLFHARTHLADLRVWGEATSLQPGLANADVYALLLEPAGNDGKEHLLVGSFGGGLDAIMLPDGDVRHLPLPGPETNEQRFNGITSLLRTRSGTLWATTNEGVYRWQRPDGDFRVYSPDEDGNPGYSFALFEDHAGRVWIGSAGEGLYLHQSGHDDFRRFRPLRGDPHSLPDDFVTALIEDRFERLWVGTRSGGIGLCRLREELACEHIVAGAGPVDVSHDHITALLQAGDGAIWVATAGGGIDRFELDATGAITSVRRWNRDAGLDDANVMAMVEALDGTLWFSTHGGLSHLDPASGALSNFTPGDGLPTAVFNPKAALIHDGRLWFGSTKGVIALDPERMPAHDGQPAATVISAISGLDPTHQPAHPAWQLDALQLPWRTPFSLEFAVLGYSGAAARFQYRLDPASPWLDLGERSQLTLHALEPGRHWLEVRGREGGRGWSQTPPLLLDIVPPWWRRGGVQLTTGTALLLLVLGVFLLRLRNLQARNRELHHLHGLRQAALDEARQSEARVQEALATQRRMAMRLEAASERERSHLARELHDEFGQALTSAKINLGLAMPGLAATDGSLRLRETIDLIDGLIGQVRALSLDLRPPLLDEVGLVAALESHLASVRQRSRVRLDAQIDPELPALPPGSAIAVFRVVQEAVTNCLRHADAQVLSVNVVGARGGVAIQVQDDGRGFDPASPGNAAGLGLFGMRERAHDLGGEWAVESAPGRGTIIRAFIPATPASGAR